MALTLRMRMTIWYSAVVVLSLLAFGAFNYAYVSSQLNSNLNSSLQRVAESLEIIIRRQQKQNNIEIRPVGKTKQQAQGSELENFKQRLVRDFVGPLRPAEDEQEETLDAVWTAVYEHILLNPKNYYIQVVDTAGAIAWRSDNLGLRSLPIAKRDADGPRRQVQVVDQMRLFNQAVRLLHYSTASFSITIAYPLSEVQTTLNDLFSSLLFAFPAILLISIAGGLLLARFSLRPIDTVTKTAREITAHNLERRIPVPPVNDEISRLASTLNRMIERLEGSFAQIRQFTGDASHELRTPLAIMMGELEVALRSPKTTEEYEEIIASTLEEVNRLSKVVANLLELSRAETGQVEIDKEPVDLSSLVADIAEDAEILAEDKNISVASSLETPVVIQGDKVRLHQAILNVIDNAIKYNRSGGSVIIELAKQEQTAILTIRDTGIGIPEDDVDKVFDRFFRVDKARSQSVSGHGLGLAIVRWVVEAHGGTIGVASSYGQGTVFTLVFPA